MGDLPLIGHNIVFDKTFLNRSLINNNLPIISNRTVDTLMMAKRLLKDGGDYKLMTLIDRLGLEHTDYHRSLGDCEATKVLYEKLINL